jgi:proteasome lid subunit RPN8/RPN11
MMGRELPVALPLMSGALDPRAYAEHVTADGRRVFVAHQVLRDLSDLERSDHPNETAGLLFGGYFADRGDDVAVVTRLIPPEAGEVIGTPHTVTITADGAQRMTARAWCSDPTLKPVGWGHTHPCFEAFFSGTDRTEQRLWKERVSVGIVMSGLDRPKQRYRVFVGPDSTPAPPNRRVMVSPGKSERPVVSSGRSITMGLDAGIVRGSTGPADTQPMPPPFGQAQPNTRRAVPMSPWTGMAQPVKPPQAKHQWRAPRRWPTLLGSFILLLMLLLLAAFAAIAWFPPSSSSPGRTPIVNTTLVHPRTPLQKQRERDSPPHRARPTALGDVATPAKKGNADETRRSGRLSRPRPKQAHVALPTPTDGGAS